MKTIYTLVYVKDTLLCSVRSEREICAAHVETFMEIELRVEETYTRRRFWKMKILMKCERVWVGTGQWSTLPFRPPSSVFFFHDAVRVHRARKKALSSIVALRMPSMDYWFSQSTFNANFSSCRHSEANERARETLFSRDIFFSSHSPLGLIFARYIKIFCSRVLVILFCCYVYAADV